MKKLYVLFLLFLSQQIFAQNFWDELNGKEKAFVYHQTRKVENLKSELFHLFMFTDSIPYINDTLPDYGYIEKQIVQDPERLILKVDEFERKSTGLVNDLVVRFVLRELGTVLHFRNSTNPADKPLKEKLRVFEKYVLEEAPQTAIRTLNNGDYVLIESLQGYYAPSLTVADKIAAIVNSGYTQLEQMLVINAIMRAEEKYVNKRTEEIMAGLGLSTLISTNFLSAVGDGRNLAEIKGGFNTPYTIGLPNENGLFRFLVYEKEDKKKEITTLEVKAVRSRSLNTKANLNHVVHVDVMGYHPERQTTIAIQNGGKSYVLYGKNEHRRVSPDSSYGEGTTYWRLMNRLENYYIANLKEDLYGKRGYEYQIDRYEKKIENTKLEIKKTEYRLDELRHTPEGKPKIKKKKIKKKDLGRSDQAGTGHPTSALSKLDKKKNIQQNKLLQLNGLLEDQKRILAELKIKMEEAYEYLVKYETQLDLMRKTIGYSIMEYEEENGVYTFNDGATFDYRTQDFTFPVAERAIAYTLNHIMFGEKVLDKEADESFVHFNISSHQPSSKYVMKRVVAENESNKLSVKDSLQLLEVFDFLAVKDIDLNLTVIAGGIVDESQGNYQRSTSDAVLPYQENTETNEHAVPHNGVTLFEANRKIHLNMQVTVYEDDMLPKNFPAYQDTYLKYKKKYPKINEIDFYSGVLAYQQANKWIELMEQKAEAWIKDGQKKKQVLSKLKKAKVKKIEFVNGTYLIKAPKI